MKKNIKIIIREGLFYVIIVSSAVLFFKFIIDALLNYWAQEYSRH